MLKKIILRWIVRWRKCPSDRVQAIRKNCIYSPSCSAYMFLYIRRHGLFRGVWNGFFRLKKCDPKKHSGGKDPVP